MTFFTAPLVVLLFDAATASLFLRDGSRNFLRPGGKTRGIWQDSGACPPKPFFLLRSHTEAGVVSPVLNRRTTGITTLKSQTAVFPSPPVSFLESRNSLEASFYSNLMKPLFFQIDPEQIHNTMISTGHTLGSHAPLRSLLALHYNCPVYPSLSQTVAGLSFDKPVGLGAGFDKNGQLVDLIGSLGFGFIEVGSLSSEASEGNPGKRLWRLPHSESICVWMGLNNRGAPAVAEELKSRKRTQGQPVGISIAPTNSKATAAAEPATEDILKAYEIVSEVADYVTINLSCPNTHRDPSDPSPFKSWQNVQKLLERLKAVREEKSRIGLSSENTKVQIPPVFLKLGPDWAADCSDLRDVLAVCREHSATLEREKGRKKGSVSGLILSNLTKGRGPEIPLSPLDPSPPADRGGLSGRAVREKADAALRFAFRETGGEVPLIGLGGVFSAEDAYQKVRLGASLVQLVSGLIFRGPTIASDVLLGLVERLERDGFSHISEAVGVDA